MERIRSARKTKNLSQRELEALTGVRQSVIARFETGGTDPRLTTLVSLLTALGLELTVQPVAAPQPRQLTGPIPAGD